MHAQYTIQVKAEQSDLFVMGDVKKINTNIVSNLSRIVAQLGMRFLTPFMNGRSNLRSRQTISTPQSQHYVSWSWYPVIS